MRLSFHSIAYIFALIPSVTPKYADPEDLGLYYDAKLNTDNKTATITLSGNFTDSKTWMGFGIPYDPFDPTMIGSDLYVAYPNQTAGSSGVVLVHGSGRPIRGGVFAQVADDAYDGSVVLNQTASYFNTTTKTLVVVFVRPLIAAQTPIVLNTEPPMVPMNLTTRNYTYLYALGKVINGTIIGKHTDRGVTYNVTLFSDASGVGVTHLAQAATSTSSAFSPIPCLALVFAVMSMLF